MSCVSTHTRFNTQIFSTNSMTFPSYTRLGRPTRPTYVPILERERISFIIKFNIYLHRF